MAPAPKVAVFHRECNNWYCTFGLPSDITVSINDTKFHFHKFPLASKCGRIAKLLEESKSTNEKSSNIVLETPGGTDIFLVAAKFCYGARVEMTPKNIILIYCAADYLEMTDEYGEGNLLSKSESFFHKNILHSWKECILAFQSSEPVISRAEKLQILRKCSVALSMMACTDPSLFGWPMMMYGSLQSPGGSILWNGINTGARIHGSESDWWFDDVSYLSISMFERLIKTMEERGIRPENIAGAIMYYCRKYLPGLGRWQVCQSGRARTLASFSLTPAAIDQRIILESIERLLPQKKGKSFCRFLLGLLRVAFILDASQICKESLEKRIGMQLEFATLDSLLIPSYSDSDTLYNTECVKSIVCHFLSSESSVNLFSPLSSKQRESPPFGPLRKVAKLIDDYIAEIASDVNLKQEKIRSLAEAIPDSWRPLHDALYRAIDIYLKAHPWLSDKDKEELCNIIDYQKLSMEACAHASQNERLPLRVVLQVLFFEQLQLRTALAGCLHLMDTESGPATQLTLPSDMAGQIIQRDGWVKIVRENSVLKVDMERMGSRVRELEDEFSHIKQEMKNVTKSRSSLSSPRLVSRGKGCKPLRPSDAHPDGVDISESTPRASINQARRRSCHLSDAQPDAVVISEYTPRGSIDQARRRSHHLSDARPDFADIFKSTPRASIDQENRRSRLLSDSQPDAGDISESTPRASIDKARSRSHHSRDRKSFSFL